MDSREVEPGFLFVAVRGLTVDGHNFVSDAVRRKAAAVMVDRPVQVEGETMTVVVADTAEALGLATASFHGRPSESLVMVGLTGTNGKTTTCYLMESILEAAGQRPGVLGTVNIRFADIVRRSPFTTPTAGILNKTLKEMVGSGCTHVVMEVSSHALELRRVSGLRFDVAGFTNLTQDHLDLHGDMERYFEAKQTLFTRHLKRGGRAVIWADDPAAERMVEPCEGGVIRCSMRDPEADVFLVEADTTLLGTKALIRAAGRDIRVESSLLGRPNVQNILLACGLGLALGLPLDAVEAGVASLSRAPGRLDRVTSFLPSDPAVLVDYAHTPDAIKQVLAALRPMTRGRLFILFGCGGDRDRAKRPLMGKNAAEGADLVVVTSDNPRTEDPLAIIADIVGGLEHPETVIVQPDRRLAIGEALAQARSGDVVMILGKGHESGQEFATETIPFDDRRVARELLLARLGDPAARQERRP